MSSEDANPIEDRQIDNAVKVSADDVGFRIQTDIDEKKSGLRKALFICAWALVSSWISANLEAAILKRNSRRVLSYCWHVWMEEAGPFPPPLVDSSESDSGFQHGEPSRRPSIETSTYPPPLESSSASDEQPEDDVFRILVWKVPVCQRTGLIPRRMP